MDLSVIIYLQNWAYSRNTNLLSISVSSNLFPHGGFQFFLVLSWWCVGTVKSFAVAEHVQWKASPSAIKAHCKDFYISEPA